MAFEADVLSFIAEDQPGGAPAGGFAPWKIAVVDDDPAVHDGTRFALQDFELDGRGVELLSARSAREGRDLLRRVPDVAIVLLDVVMETEGAGLELVEFIRAELKNETTRIILRTGQPGQAPERRVVVDYDINDYKAKTELTAERLFTSITSALRSYEQLRKLVETRRGLEIIVDAAATLFDVQSLQKLAEGVLTQLSSLLDVVCAGMLVLRGHGDGESLSVLAGSGCYSGLARHPDSAPLARELKALIEDSFRSRRHSFATGRCVLYVGTGCGREVVVMLDTPRAPSDTDRALLEVFCSRLSIAFDNVILYDQLQRANSELEERVHERTEQLEAANERLEAQSARLRTANAFKDDVLGIVAHDLKNPLSVILGRTEMLNDLLQSGPDALVQAGQQVAHIRDSARRLTDMVEDLIGQAMADAYDIALQPDEVDLAHLVDRVVEQNRTTARRKGQTLQFAPAGRIMATADYDRLAEAIDNLVSNAVKYGPPGSEIHVSIAGEGGEALVRVRDQGPGLPPEDLPRIFGRFQRLSAKPTGGEASTGLGLSIAKRIVDLHGGRIFVEETELSRGTTFALALPAVGGSEAG